MRYTIMKYLRISSEDADLDGLDKHESNSIQNQRDYLDEFISKMPEYGDCEVLEVVDDGRTGTNFRRPGIQTVLDLARQGKIQCIIVKDLSRFGRNYIETGDYLEQIFPAWGVRFVSVNDMYDSADFLGTTGGINIAFRNLIAEMYSRDLSEKIRSAKNTLSKSGKSLGPYTFYGYIADSADHHKLVIDEPAAEIVRLIFNLYEQGMSLSKIARKLNDDGIQTASERKREQGAKCGWLKTGSVNMWSHGFIGVILHDERYTGKLIYGRKRRIELGRRELKAMPASEWIVVPDAFPPIITAEQYKRVQELMNAARIVPSGKRKNADPLLFSRKLCCGICGRALRRVWSAKGYRYRCITSEADCMRGSINEKTIFETVLMIIQQRGKLADNVKMQKLAKKKSPVLESADFRSEIQNLQQLIQKLSGAKLEIWEKHHMGQLSKEMFQRQSKMLAEQAAMYADKVKELETKIHRLKLESSRENTFEERFSRQAGITELSQEVVKEFIKEIYVYAPDRIEITLNYADEYENAGSFFDSAE